MVAAEWRVCIEFPSYLISDSGDVRRILRDKRGRSGDFGRILKPSESHGYWHVILMRNGERFSRNIHRLVATAFLGAPPSSEHQVAHWDGDRKNNCRSNLRWATPSENTADRLRHGTMHVRTHNSKLRAVDIERIRYLAESGVKNSQLADQYRVQDSHIGKVVRGLKWRQSSDPRAG